MVARRLGKDGFNVLLLEAFLNYNFGEVVDHERCHSAVDWEATKGNEWT